MSETRGLDWRTALPAAFRERAPMRLPELGPFGGLWYLDGRLWPRPYPAPVPFKQRPPRSGPGLPPDAGRGMWEPALRLKDMDAEGIDIAEFRACTPLSPSGQVKLLGGNAARLFKLDGRRPPP